MPRAGLYSYGRKSHKGTMACTIICLHICTLFCSTFSPLQSLSVSMRILLKLYISNLTLTTQNSDTLACTPGFVICGDARVLRLLAGVVSMALNLSKQTLQKKINSITLFCQYQTLVVLVEPSWLCRALRSLT